MNRSLPICRGRLAILFCAIAISTQAAQGRRATLFLSDGTTETGELSLYPGRKFIVITAAGVNTADLGRTEALATNYGQERKPELELIKEIAFMPRNDREKDGERMEREWDWKERHSGDSTKVYRGKPFPVRETVATFTLNSGEELTGTLQTMAIYLRPEKSFTAKKYIIRSKQVGKEGQAMKDLVHIERIRFLDEGKQFAAQLKLVFKGQKLGTDDEVRAITRTSLTPVPVVRDKTAPDTCIVNNTWGEGVFVAVKQGNKRFAGWPETDDPELFQITEDFVLRQRDYYNEKKLLGVYRPPNSKDVLALVSLRRRVPPNALPLTGERDPVTGKFMEFFRLSIWRWRYDEEETNMILVKRGTFFRERLEVEDDTPHAAVSRDLWTVSKGEDGFTVGE